jgi:hypothetical protein
MLPVSGGITQVGLDTAALPGRFTSLGQHSKSPEQARRTKLPKDEREARAVDNCTWQKTQVES